ncbi:MAG: capsule assembly Wzi family protein, partial [Candidatus Edwardsbacteria bacterium]|nr:capsule assembly Wzi family protein [Candidatus Edwardsbacteria bacterium]
NKYTGFHIVIFLFAIMAVAAQAQDYRDLPLDHWAYPILERFETKGWITLPPNKPFTRVEALNAIAPLFKIKNEPDSATYDGVTRGVSIISIEVPVGIPGTIDRTNFFRFYRELSELNRHHTRPDDVESDMFAFRNTGFPDLALGLDASVTPTAVASKGNEPKYSARGEIDLWGRFRATPAQEFLFDQRLAFIAEKEETKARRISSTTQTWRDGKFGIDYSYFRYANPYVSVTAGRRQFWWGQGINGTMLLSTNAPAFDAVSFRAQYKRLGFESFFGILSTEQQRYFSGHRGTLRLPWHFTAGFSEVVVYKAKNIDPVYVNPILPYYGTQWNEREDDNILWNLDLKWTLGHGFKAWGELLMDDVQYEQNPPAPQKLGFLLGAHWADPFKLPDTDLKAEWAGNQKWVYTQRKYENRYMGSDTLSVIGHWIGTDGDAFDLVLDHRFHPRLNLGLGYGWRRKGEGRIDRGLHYAGELYTGGYVAPADTANGQYIGDDQRTRFLTGVVERQDLVSATLRWEPFFWMRVSGRTWLGYTKNAAQVPGQGRNDAGAELSVKLDY